MKTLTFFVDWHTRIGVGSTYYSGREKVLVNCDDNDDASQLTDAAKDKAQWQVRRRAFPDRGIDHIVITDVTEATR